MGKAPENLAVSIRAKLLNYAREQRQPFDQILTRFTLERLLYRLGQSKYSDQFVLKGAMLLTTWFDEPGRPTRDIDLLGFGDDDSDALLAKFREILSLDFDDGIDFNLKDLRVDRIREELEYGGVRLRTTAILDSARIGVKIDIGFGDAIEPGLEELEYPSLLDLPPPVIRVYARETVVAEKFQAIVTLGRANSRMKDYYDIWLITQNSGLDNDRLAKAIAATFERRKTNIPVELPDGFTDAFANDPVKQTQWEAFKRNLSVDPGELDLVVKLLAEFLMPYAKRALETQ